MANVSANVGLAVRILVCLTVFSGCITALVGIRKAQDKTVPKSLFNGSQCLLFGRWFSVPDNGRRAFGGGSEGWCRFVEFSAGYQLCIALIMTAVAVAKLMQFQGVKVGTAARLEQLVVVTAFAIAVLGAAVVSTGMAETCTVLFKGWKAADAALIYSKHEVPKRCHDEFVFAGNATIAYATPFKFHQYLNMAQVGLWLTCVWLIHILIIPIMTRLRWYRKVNKNSVEYMPMADIL